MIVGNVVSAGLGQGVARAISVKSGIPIETPAYSLNMVCGSGMKAIMNAANEMRLGEPGMVVAGGVEFMSNDPFATDTYMRLGKKFGDFKMVDLMVHDGLTDSFSGVHMGVTAENVAKRLHVSREAQDEYALLTQQRAAAADDAGCFRDEIVPLTLHDYRGREYTFERDEFIRRDTSAEALARLKPSFIKDGTGTVTAGNTSGINDGAAFCLVASEDYANEKGFEPALEIVDYVSVGLDPQVMGLGPYYSITKLLERNGMTWSDIDYYEVNEAFAAQVLGSMSMLEERWGVKHEEMIARTNVWGSGIALGHPLGATGARLLVTLRSILDHYDAEWGVASLCIGGGMGNAMLVRRMR